MSKIREFWIRVGVCTNPAVFDKDPAGRNFQKGETVHVVDKAAFDEITEDLSVARQSLYEVVEQRNALFAENAELRKTSPSGRMALEIGALKDIVRDGLHLWFLGNPNSIDKHEWADRCRAALKAGSSGGAK